MRQLGDAEHERVKRSERDAVLALYPPRASHPPGSSNAILSVWPTRSTPLRVPADDAASNPDESGRG